MKAVVGLIFILFVPGIAAAQLHPQRSVLENGLVIVTSEQRDLPIVAINLIVRAGSTHDATTHHGVANLVARLLTYGTERRNAMQISGTLDHVGASLSARCGKEVATLRLNILKKDLDLGLGLLAEILTSSVFPEEEIGRIKQSLKASIKAKQNRPRVIAREHLMKALLPGNPYGLPVEGTEASLEDIQRQDLLAFYQRHYVPNQSILAAVGDISHLEITEKLRTVLSKWEARPVAAENVPKAKWGSARTLRIDRNLTQANLVMGHAGIARKDPDYYAVRVMNHILGGGSLSSRLGNEIRNERGLAYSVQSQFSSRKDIGTFVVSMQTKNRTAKEAIEVTKREIERIRNTDVSDEELREAKDYLIGSFPLRLDTNRRIARFLARIEYLGLGLDYSERYPNLIESVTKQDVRRVAQEHLHPNHLILVVVGNLQKAGFEPE